jgi:hypothetical protein
MVSGWPGSRGSTNSVIADANCAGSRGKWPVRGAGPHVRAAAPCMWFVVFYFSCRHGALRPRAEVQQRGDERKERDSWDATAHTRRTTAAIHAGSRDDVNMHTRDVAEAASARTHTMQQRRRWPGLSTHGRGSRAHARRSADSVHVRARDAEDAVSTCACVTHQRHHRPPHVRLNGGDIDFRALIMVIYRRTSSRAHAGHGVL